MSAARRVRYLYGIPVDLPAETLLPQTVGAQRREVQSTRTALYSTPLRGGEPLPAGGTVTDIQAINTL